MLCAAARGTIIVTTAGAPTATGTIRTTGTTISGFVAPVLTMCGVFRTKPESRSLWRTGACVFESRPCSRVGWLKMQPNKL